MRCFQDYSLQTIRAIWHCCRRATPTTVFGKYADRRAGVASRSEYGLGRARRRNPSLAEPSPRTDLWRARPITPHRLATLARGSCIPCQSACPSQTGHYGMGTFLDCFLRPWDNRCATAKIRYDPGARGFTPVLNRGKQYYMLLVVDRGLPMPIIPPDALDKIACQANSARCIEPLRFALMRAVERTLGLWQGPEHELQQGKLPYPQNEVCAVAS